jgi:hypothetical protein
MATLRVFDVRQGPNWARAYVQPLADEDNRGLMLTVHSSFGAHGHVWQNTGGLASLVFLTSMDAENLVARLLPAPAQTSFHFSRFCSELARRLDTTKSADVELTEELEAFAAFAITHVFDEAVEALGSPSYGRINDEMNTRDVQPWDFYSECFAPSMLFEGYRDQVVMPLLHVWRRALR